MTGTLINMGAIVAGTAIGSLAGSRLPARMRRIVLYGIGLVVLLIGFQMAVRTQNVLAVLGAILIGGIIGELLRLEDRLEQLGQFFQDRFSKGSEQSIAEGFVTASLVFCVGPMAILGSISDGLSGDYSLLSIKAVMDGFASIAFAASMGWGVGLSAVSILIYQGAITLFAGSLPGALNDAMITEMTATGGLIIIGIGIKLLDLKDLPLANFVPAIAVAPAILALIPFFRGLF
ncbi:MAG: DUF554 domain-containing protein [Syntrophobacteraceae bacterium]|jgi:uncharacterized membrane protein YqgA involved in biofilm formation